MEKTIQDQLLTEAETAELCEISQSMVRKLVGMGLLTRAERGKYRLGDVLQGFAAYYAMKHQGKEGDVSYSEEKALLTKAQREKAEIELGELKDEIYRADYIVPKMQELLLGVRNRLLSIPARCAAQVVACDDMLDATEIIRREVYDALTELVTWKPDSLKRRRANGQEGWNN